MEVHSNPVACATAQATVLMPAGTGGGQLVLFDGLGHMLSQQAVAKGVSQVAVLVGQLPTGLYLLRYKVANGRYFATRLQRD